jgi:hypothetical protein
MRNVLLLIALASFLLLMMQCSEDETLNSFDGKLVVIASPYIKNDFKFPIYRYTIQTDSIKWLYDCEPGKDSRVSIIAGGKFKKDTIISYTGDDPSTAKIDSVLARPIKLTDLSFGIETLMESSHSFKQVEIDTDGTFLDTFLISSSPVSERILIENSRLCAMMKTYNDTLRDDKDSIIDIIIHEINDTVPLPNPHGLRN